MNPDPAPWIRLVGLVAIEVVMIATLAALVAGRFRPPHLRRWTWHTALLLSALVGVAEVAGVRGVFRAPPPAAGSRTLTTRVVEDSPDGAVLAPDPGSRVSDSAPVEARVSPEPVVAWWPGVLWAAGTLLLLLREGVVRLWLARRAGHAGTVDELTRRSLDRMAGGFGLPGVAAGTWPRIPGPFAFGMRRPALALPEDFRVRFTEAQQEAMLLHELAHLAADDPRTLLSGRVVVALLWWHPAAWWMQHRLHAEMEASADSATRLQPGAPAALAESILAVARRSTPLGSVMARGLGVVGGGSRRPIARRVRALLADAPTTWRARARHARPATLLLVGVACGSLGFAQPEPDAPRVFPHRGLGSRSDLPTTPPETAPVPLTAAESAGNGVEPPPRPVELASVADSDSDSGLDPDPNPASPNPLSPPSQTVPAIPAVPAERTEPGSPGPATSPAATSPKPDEPIVALEIKILELRDSDAGDVGLDWIFGQSSTNDAPAGFEVPSGDLPGAGSPHAGNIRVRTQRLEGQVVTLSEAQTAMLLRALERRGGVEIMATPRITARSGQEAQLAIQETITAVTGVGVRRPDDPQGPGVSYATEQIPLGPCVTVVSVWTNEAWSIRVAARLSEFLGHEDPELPRLDGTPPASTNRVLADLGPGRAPIRGQVPLPLIRVRETYARGQVASGQSLLLRGSRAERTEVIRGNWLRKPRTRTEFRRLYVLVTPLAEG